MSAEIYSWSNDRRTCDRRRRRLNLVLHERRSGFDRRRPPARGPATAALEGVLAGLRLHRERLIALLGVVNLLNLADYLLTLNVLSTGGGEANPIMRSLFSLDPVYAGLFKLAAVFLATLLVWGCRRFRSALEAALIMVAIFGVVLLYHVFGLLVLS